MKILKNLIIVLLVIVSFAQCKKEDNVIDYREVFCGNFLFKTITGWETIDNTGNSYTTEFYSTITMVENTDSLILIKYKSGENTLHCGTYNYGSSIGPIIKPDGKLVFDINTECPHTIFIGFFVGTDSIEIEIKEYSLGGIDYQKISGVRKNTR